ncbi:MAG: phosphonate ABC transporter ATP-binding protein [Pikeienuella sp.]|uniref:phosphonate ABC transporter ATP-binding protein n=1 Tax=Pikeienuella sp. TaxID=2831957 RepID=UPI003919A034
MSAPAVALDGVGFRRPGAAAPALESIDLSIAAGEVVALVGPSGAGKSTLLTLLDGRLRGWTGCATTLGRALYPDRPPPRAARAETGFVFQSFALVERATTRRNVLNGRLGRMPLLPSLMGRARPEDDAAVSAALRDVGLLDAAVTRVDRLSGGQRQRVALARCLAQEPRLILADEPVASLDPRRAREALRLLADLAISRGATLIFSSHQPALALEVATRAVALRDGRIAFDGPARELTETALEDVYGAAPRASLRLAG